MDVFSPQMTTGLNPAAGVSTSVSSWTPNIASASGPACTEPPWSPSNPLFWFAGILLVTVGAIAANASIRVGKFSASAGAGAK